MLRSRYLRIKHEYLEFARYFLNICNRIATDLQKICKRFAKDAKRCQEMPRDSRKNCKRFIRFAKGLYEIARDWQQICKRFTKDRQ